MPPTAQTSQPSHDGGGISQLTSDTVLELADGVAVHRSNGAFRLTVGGRRLWAGRYTLPILEAFSSPTAFGDALRDLEHRLRSVPAWVEVVAHVKALHQHGVLVVPGEGQSARRSHEKRFDSPPVHIRMLDDEQRTSRFQEAVRRTVKAGDVVVDIGTGTGVLAVTAAMAGARHVYAIEATDMAQTAQRIVEANGMGDRVTVLQAHSSDVELPERADVLVSEIIGDDPLGERILPTFDDARRRLLVEDARLVPAGIRVLVLPLEVPVERLHAALFTPSRVSSWSERYGIDFDALLGERHDERLHVNSADIRDWKRLTAPLVVADLDLLAPHPDVLEWHGTVRTVEGGRISGVLVFFDARLADSVQLSLHPDDATPTNSWGNLLYLLASPVDVAAGDEVEVHYRFDDVGSRLTVGRADAP